MKAMILAAGLGTRLRPITNTIPKALISVGGQTVLSRVINHLKTVGVKEIIINTHHLATKIMDYLINNNNFGIKIEISYEEELLDTGGGLKKASYFFDDNQPFFLYNVDIISDCSLKDMMIYHKVKKADVTLAVNRRKTARKFLFNDEMQLVGWENTLTDEIILSQNCNKPLRLGFCGIHLISPEIFKHFPEKNIFSMTDFYLQLAAKNFKIMGFPIDGSMWFDIGSKEKLELARNKFGE